MSLAPTPPTVGRIVHFHTQDTAGPYAAVVSAVGDGHVCTLHVFDPSGGVKCQVGVPYGTGYVGGYRWSWPPKV